MEYLVEGKSYSFNYQELKEQYEQIASFTDIEFWNKAAEILHFVCFVGFIKNIPSYILLNDKGLIHELVHIIHLNDFLLIDIEELRNQFNIWCKLV